MRIKKILNNSLILVEDENGKENILMGKGLGFKFSAKSTLSKKDIEQVFVLKDENILSNIIQLAKEVDGVYFEISKTVIDYATNTHQLELMNHIYLALTDHLSFAVRRYQNGIFVPNFFPVNIKVFYPEEYDVGVFALRELKEQLGIELPEDESKNITLHFVNAQYQSPYSDENEQINILTRDILTIVRYHFNVHFLEESLSYNRFVTHLNTFGKRLLQKDAEFGENTTFIYEQVKKNCPDEYECVLKINSYLTNKKFPVLQSADKLYLMVHIHQILENGTRKE